MNVTQYNKLKFYEVAFFFMIFVCVTYVKYRGAGGGGGGRVRISGQSRKEAKTIHNSFEG